MKTVDFSDSLAACDQNVCRIGQLNEYLKVRLGNFLTLVQGHLHMKIKTGFSQRPLGRFELKFCRQAFMYMYKEMIIC